MKQIFSRQTLKAHRDRSSHFIEDNFLHQTAAKMLFERINILNIIQGKALEISANAGFLSQFLSNFDLTVTDSSSLLLALNPCKKQICLDDEELNLAFEENDLVLSCLNVHWINDVLLFFKQIYNNLKPGGTFLANFIGGKSLKSLRTRLVNMEIASRIPSFAHISPFILKEDISSLMLKAGFKKLVVDSDVLEVSYPNILALMRDLQKMGQSNKLLQSAGKSLSKKLYFDLLASSEAMLTDFEIITLCGQK